MKEDIQIIHKTWGKEIVIANNDRYCGKLLVIDKDAQSSYHYHKTKKETFFGLGGQVCLTVEKREYYLMPFTRPKTIKAGQVHMFKAMTDSLLLEISTPHNENDVVRATESVEGID